jgi:protein-S-isoprenylcysteine O-methyltransferase Ste14
VNPWFGKGLLLAGLVATIAIRAPHDTVSKKTPVAENRRGGLEVLLLALMMIGTVLLPLAYVATPVLAFADHELSPVALGAGVLVMLLSLWLFHRSHADLGRNWSMTLAIRDGHELVTGGVYARIRHPMYTALFLYGFAQALVLANWVAGLSFLAAFTLMFAARLRREERMMVEKFGDGYEDYRRRTKRLVPFVW